GRTGAHGGWRGGAAGERSPGAGVDGPASARRSRGVDRLPKPDAGDDSQRAASDRAPRGGGPPPRPGWRRAPRRGPPRDARGSARDSSLGRSRALLSPALSARAIAVPFRLLGDGKVMVRGRVSDPAPPEYSRALNLVVDTGATKCVLFEDRLTPGVKHADAWPA